MRPRHLPSTTGPERGIALITVLLIMLVLTAVGVGLSLLSRQEDRTANRQEMQQAALYAAEAGLRRGEDILDATAYNNVVITTMLNHVPVAETPVVEPQVPQHPTTQLQYDATHLGTYLTATPPGGFELANQEIPMAPSGSTTGRRAFCSLYIRNNTDDTGPLVNSDPKIQLISVGWIVQAGKPIAVKIVGEEFNWSGVNQGSSLQKQINPGGTGAGVYGGSTSTGGPGTGN